MLARWDGTIGKGRGSWEATMPGLFSFAAATTPESSRGQRRADAVAAAGATGSPFTGPNIGGGTRRFEAA